MYIHQALSKKCLSGKTALQELGVQLRFQLYPEMQCGIRTVVTARGEVGNCWEIQQRSWIFLGKQECSEVAIVSGNSCSFEKYFLLYSALRISVLKKQKAHTFLIIGHLLQCHFLLDSCIRICETWLVVVFSWLIGGFCFFCNSGHTPQALRFRAEKLSPWRENTGNPTGLEARVDL